MGISGLQARPEKEGDFRIAGETREESGCSGCRSATQVQKKGPVCSAAALEPDFLAFFLDVEGGFYIVILLRIFVFVYLIIHNSSLEVYSVLYCHTTSVTLLVLTQTLSIIFILW